MVREVEDDGDGRQAKEQKGNRIYNQFEFLLANNARFNASEVDSRSEMFRKWQCHTGFDVSSKGGREPRMQMTRREQKRSENWGNNVARNLQYANFSIGENRYVPNVTSICSIFLSSMSFRLRDAIFTIFGLFFLTVAVSLPLPEPGICRNGQIANCVSNSNDRLARELCKFKSQRGRLVSRSEAVAFGSAFVGFEDEKEES